ncbi:MAG TPA: iron transporter FeoB [Firmicutes bacterium]|jgi:Fe2+ transport system protein B|nr:iron transporter FeoB [Bacillota bacterium]
MGLTCQSCGRNACRTQWGGRAEHDYTIALAGNPNTGKSTVFNALTGLKQHTGNWPGKTVWLAQGYFQHRDKMFCLVDLPGTYSLFATSADEQVARDFICFGRPDVIVVVTDATCLERNLNLVLQVLEITTRVVVCVNLIDEAQRKGIHVDVPLLAQELGVPALATAARDGEGLPELLDAIYAVATGEVNPNPRLVNYPDEIAAAIDRVAARIGPMLPDGVNARWVALGLLEGDESILATARANAKETQLSVWGKEVSVFAR